MGALATFGDSVIYLAIGGLLLILLITLAQQGFILSPLLFVLLMGLVTFILRFKSFDFGLKRGISLAKVMTEERMKGIREFTEKLAVLSVGAIIPIVFQIRPSIGMDVLMALDAQLMILSITLLISSLMGLALTLFTQYFHKKGVKLIYVLAIIFMIGFVLGALGVFGVIGQIQT